jgi:3-phenylpropionate/trans-cinnamate dioxygenase ferredoxin component
MWIELGPVENFENDRLVVKVEGERYPVLIVRIDQEVFAIADVCTHDKSPLSDGPVENCHIACTRHGARFDLRTGKATLPAPRPVKTYPARLEGGIVYLELI